MWSYASPVPAILRFSQLSVLCSVSRCAQACASLRALAVLTSEVFSCLTLPSILYVASHLEASHAMAAQATGRSSQCGATSSKLRSVFHRHASGPSADIGSRMLSARSTLALTCRFGQPDRSVVMFSVYNQYPLTLAMLPGRVTRS
jgi:hypothetical protein